MQLSLQLCVVSVLPTDSFPHVPRSVLFTLVEHSTVNMSFDTHCIRQPVEKPMTLNYSRTTHVKKLFENPRYKKRLQKHPEASRPSGASIVL